MTTHVSTILIEIQKRRLKTVTCMIEFVKNMQQREETTVSQRPES
jgi:hypothetical protein